MGQGAGLYRSTDGGETWFKLTRGLPDGPYGRCGLSVYSKDPRFVYAVIQTAQTNTKSEAGQEGKPGDRVETGGVFRSEDHGQTWTKLNDLCPRPFYFGQIRVDPHDVNRVYVLGISLHVSDDGGKTFRVNGAPNVHPDHHALWIDPRDSDHLVLGCDGGLNVSYDRGATWEHYRNLPLGQFYAVAVDQRKPYRVYGGLQDNGSWRGPSATQSFDGITTADWGAVLWADGFYCQVDPADADVVYAEGQYGMLQRVHLRTGESTGIAPRAPRGTPAYRFNWSAPLLLSAHNPRTLYYGGNHVLRSINRGDTWEPISPDLTHGKPGPSADTGHTITTLAESPLRAGLLYAGTDDGRVHITRDGGAHWTDLTDRLPGVPAQRWVTRVECSYFAEGAAYLALDRHRNDDRAPYLFKTADYGTTWQPLAYSLPGEGPVHVVREDPRNKNLLFAGTEFGLFVSLDGGACWHRLRNGLPTVSVHDLVIHPRDRDLVIGTHGRSIYIMDVAPLEELTPDTLASPYHLFDVKPVTAFRYRGSHGLSGAKFFAGTNPPFGAVIYYYLKSPLAEEARVIIADALGNPMMELKGVKEAGLHQLVWDLRRGTDGPGAGKFGAVVPPGDYAVRLKAGDQEMAKPLKIDAEH
jgi:photosystem II stability/assembly factor-like uncharacterized protein